jgi:FixJ family two-component response regulator
MVVRNHEKVVYVVDDDPAMLKSIGQLLNSLGFVTILYASAEAFLSASTISDNSNSCIVLDIQLGGMSGLELGSRLASAKQALPTIFITGNDSVSARRAALQQGCVGYFTKPFPPKLLVLAIEKALARKAGDVHPRA